jgi:hypothetical protein
VSETPKKVGATWGLKAGILILTLASAYGLARHEVVRRARQAFEEGAKYERWLANPAEKRASLQAELSSGRIAQEDYERRMEDSDLKNAVMWYETAVDLFQPPRSPWVEKSELRLKELKPKKEAWLRSLGIEPVDDSPHPQTGWHW